METNENVPNLQPPLLWEELYRDLCDFLVEWSEAQGGPRPLDDADPGMDLAVQFVRTDIPHTDDWRWVLQIYDMLDEVTER